MVLPLLKPSEKAASPSGRLHPAVFLLGFVEDSPTYEAGTRGHGLSWGGIVGGSPPTRPWATS